MFMSQTSHAETTGLQRLLAAGAIPPSVLATAQRLAPELTIIGAHQALFLKLASYTDPATIPRALINQAVAAAGAGPGTTYVKTLRGLYYLKPDLD